MYANELKKKKSKSGINFSLYNEKRKKIILLFEYINNEEI
jgi:hypothetical protein